jgi:hypothetical protein
MAIPQDLYDSEINFQISCFWNAGFEWKLGDEMNGFRARGRADTYEQAVEALASAAREHYPESLFAFGREEFEKRMERQEAA